MRPVRLTVAGVGASAPIPFDRYVDPAQAAVAVLILSGTATYTVQHTFDDIWAPGFAPGSAVWFPHPVLAGQTVNADSNYAYPPMAIRLNVTISSGGNAQIIFSQAGIL